MIYLASPYTHTDPFIREQRYHEACRAAAAITRAGLVVFSPIAHSHPLVAFGLPVDWPFWERHARAHLAACDELVVLMIDGWRQSAGVWREVQIAGELTLPISFLTVDEAESADWPAHVAAEARR
jgi:hypothetical protein